MKKWNEELVSKIVDKVSQGRINEAIDWGGENEHLLRHIGLKLDEKNNPFSEDYYKDLIKKFPTTKIHNNFGLFLSRNNRHKEAKEKYLEAIKLDPSYAWSHYNLGMVLYTQEKSPDVAEAEFRKAIMLAEQQGKLRYFFYLPLAGLLMENSDKTHEGIKMFEDLIKREPKIFLIYYSYGMEWVRQRFYKKGIRLLKKSIEVGLKYDFEVLNNYKFFIQNNIGVAYSKWAYEKYFPYLQIINSRLKLHESCKNAKKRKENFLIPEKNLKKLDDYSNGLGIIFLSTFIFVLLPINGLQILDIFLSFKMGLILAYFASLILVSLLNKKIIDFLNLNLIKFEKPELEMKNLSPKLTAIIENE